MKNLLDRSTADEVEARVSSLMPASERQWGSMAPGQVMAHCSQMFEWALGDVVPEKAPIMQLIGRMVKKKFVGNDEPLGKNSPTAKSLIVRDDRDFRLEQNRLKTLIARFRTAGPAGCSKNAHSFFGPLTPDEWAILMYKHTDHHLRQFGV